MPLHQEMPLADFEVRSSEVIFKTLTPFRVVVFVKILFIDYK